MRRIFSKKRFEFVFGKEVVVVEPLGFAAVPDNAEKDRFFALALKAGDVVYTSGGQPEKKPRAQKTVGAKRADGDTAGVTPREKS